MSDSNGVTVIGPEARRLKWSAWYIVRAAGALVVGRMHEKPPEHQGGKPSRYLQPFYDFSSGFVTTNQGMAEVHRVFPPLALSLKRMDLPDGCVLWPFTDLDDSELAGIEGSIKDAEDLWNQMRAARSGVIQAPALDLSRMPKMPKH